MRSALISLSICFLLFSCSKSTTDTLKDPKSDKDKVTDEGRPVNQSGMYLSEVHIFKNSTSETVTIRLGHQSAVIDSVAYEQAVTLTPGASYKEEVFFPYCNECVPIHPIHIIKLAHNNKTKIDFEVCIRQWSNSNHCNADTVNIFKNRTYTTINSVNHITYYITDADLKEAQ